MVEKNVRRSLSFNGLWQLYLLVSAPINFWAMLNSLRVTEAVITETNLWDGIGSSAYSMLFALVESIGVTLFFALLGILLPPRWPEKRKTILLGLYASLVTVMGILRQVNFEVVAPPELPFKSQGAFVYYISLTPRPVFYGGIALAVLLVLVVLLAALPLAAVSRWEKACRWLYKVAEPVKMLAWVYVVVSLLSLVIVVARNMGRV